jgi:uncharacterized protein (DUF433 family)
MDRITTDLRVRWGTPCLRDTGISVAHVIALRREGLAPDEILERCPELTAEDVEAALRWYRHSFDRGLLPRPPEPRPAHPRVAVDPDIQGGYPVVTGTRITVDAVVGMWEEGFGVEEILDEYPDLTVEDVEDALAYDLDAREGPVIGGAPEHRGDQG